MFEYVPYEGQEPPPWTPEPSPVRWWWTRARAVRAYERCRESLAWERWSALKMIHDLQPGHDDAEDDLKGRLEAYLMLIERERDGRPSEAMLVDEILRLRAINHRMLMAGATALIDGPGVQAQDSPRWCDRCQKYGDHHTDHHDEMVRVIDGSPS